MWKNIVEWGRSQMRLWRMRIACWIPNGPNTSSSYVKFIAFPLQQRLHERASVLRIAPLVTYSFMQLHELGRLL
jgi:hypothetical protein